jgi:HK97 family phage prohead protease
MKQTRFIPIENCGLQLRESADGQPSRTVVGRPIMFGVRSVNLTPWSDTRVVYEILEPGCITQELINRSDVVYNNNHSNDIANMIGRCRNGKGTLTLALREQYVESECDYPNTTVANDTLEQIRLGNVYGMSFAFEDDWQDTENGVSYERTNETVDGKEVWLRHVKKIVALYDVANVTHPAYEQTSVGTREQSDRINEAIDAQLKRECGDDDEAKKKAEEEAKAEEERKAAEEAAKREAEAKAKEEEEQRQLEEQEQRFREQQAMRMCAKARMLNEEILNSLEY